MPIKVPSKSAIKPIELGKIYVLLKYRSNILKVLFIIELDYFVFVHLEIDLHGIEASVHIPFLISFMINHYII